MLSRKRAGRIFIWTIPLLLAVLGAYQLVDLYAGKAAHENASRMLFEAANFQIEMMSRFMSEAKGVRTSGQLNSLKNAVYSAAYVHDRFANSFPAGQIDRLESLDELLQYVLHLQIGGDRPLKEEEREIMLEAEPLLAELAEVYAGLMTEQGKLNRYERGLLRDLDDRLLHVLKDRR